jgi:polyphosphate kinase
VVVVPVEDPRARAELLDVLDRSLADETNAWTLDSEGRWTRRSRDAENPRSVHAELIDGHLLRAAESAKSL